MNKPRETAMHALPAAATHYYLSAPAQRRKHESGHTPVKTIARHHVVSAPSSAPAIGFPIRFDAATTVYASPIFTLHSSQRRTQRDGEIAHAPDLAHVPAQLHEQARDQRDVCVRVSGACTRGAFHSHAPEANPNTSPTRTTPAPSVAPNIAKMSAAHNAIAGTSMLYTPTRSAANVGTSRPSVLPAFRIASCPSCVSVHATGLGRGKRTE